MSEHKETSGYLSDEARDSLFVPFTPTVVRDLEDAYIIQSQYLTWVAEGVMIRTRYLFTDKDGRSITPIGNAKIDASHLFPKASVEELSAFEPVLIKNHPPVAIEPVRIQYVRKLGAWTLAPGQVIKRRS